jgi:hypothetical protein
VAQGVGPEFKSQYHKKKERKKKILLSEIVRLSILFQETCHICMYWISCITMKVIFFTMSHGTKVKKKKSTGCGGSCL